MTANCQSNHGFPPGSDRARCRPRAPTRRPLCGVRPVLGRSNVEPTEGLDQFTRLHACRCSNSRSAASLADRLACCIAMRDSSLWLGARDGRPHFAKRTSCMGNKFVAGLGSLSPQRPLTERATTPQEKRSIRNVVYPTVWAVNQATSTSPSRSGNSPAMHSTVGKVRNLRNLRKVTEFLTFLTSKFAKNARFLTFLAFLIKNFKMNRRAANPDSSTLTRRAQRLFLQNPRFLPYSYPTSTLLSPYPRTARANAMTCSANVRNLRNLRNVTEFFHISHLEIPQKCPISSISHISHQISKKTGCSFLSRSFAFIRGCRSAAFSEEGRNTLEHTRNTQKHTQPNTLNPRVCIEKNTQNTLKHTQFLLPPPHSPF